MTSIMAPICQGCTRLHGDLRDPKCDAFPDGIPVPILISKADHREPYEGDNGLQFNPENAKATAYADVIFGSGKDDKPKD